MLVKLDLQKMIQMRGQVHLNRYVTTAFSKRSIYKGEYIFFKFSQIVLVITLRTFLKIKKFLCNQSLKRIKTKTWFSFGLMTNFRLLFQIRKFQSCKLFKLLRCFSSGQVSLSSRSLSFPLDLLNNMNVLTCLDLQTIVTRLSATLLPIPSQQSSFLVYQVSFRTIFRIASLGWWRRRARRLNFANLED